LIQVNGLERLKNRLTRALEQFSSLDEFKEWLNSQDDVESVMEMNGLIKTHPPQKEFRVVFSELDGKKVRMIDVYILPDGRVAFAGLHDP
jgi:hypothetical protein